LTFFFVSTDDFSVEKYPSTLADVTVRLGDLKFGTITLLTIMEIPNIYTIMVLLNLDRVKHSIYLP